MTAPVSLAADIGVVLLDIEGTTTPINFVHDVLFPYARARVHAYLERTLTTDNEIQTIVDGLKAEHVRDLAEGESPPAWLDPSSGEHVASITRYVHWLMDRDRKSGPLKALQGRIWESGYETGELRGEVYGDVPRAFARWVSAGVRISIFSSGSVLAQKLLFKHSTAGDLSGFLSGYFDTAVGAKRESGSYRRIAEALGVRAERVLFLSDVAAELDAARDAGLQTLLCVRPPAARPVSSVHPIVEHFDVIVAGT